MHGLTMTLLAAWCKSPVAEQAWRCGFLEALLGESKHANARPGRLRLPGSRARHPYASLAIKTMRKRLAPAASVCESCPRQGNERVRDGRISAVLAPQAAYAYPSPPSTVFDNVVLARRLPMHQHQQCFSGAASCLCLPQPGSGESPA